MKTKNLLLFITLLVFSCTEKEKTCIITGEVIDRPESKNLLLVKAFEDARRKTIATIPIKDGNFSYSFNFENTECYVLIFEDEHQNGSWRPIKFFLCDGKVNIRLHQMDRYSENSVEGGKLNRQFYDFNNKLETEFAEKEKQLDEQFEELYQADELYSDTMKVVFNTLRNTKDREELNRLYKLRNNLKNEGLAYSQKGKVLNEKSGELMSEMFGTQLDFIEKHQTIPSFYMLIDVLNWYKQEGKYVDVERLKTLQKKYATKFKNHPYTERSNDILWNIDNIKIGSKYYDFTLNDTDGKEYKLSELIENKIAFIGIWAPWCGPCIQTSRSMKSVYEDFKDKDFVVVGIASKYKNFENVKKVLEKDKYPWITLIDEPDANSKINEKYGIENAGGGTYLVDRNGSILAINPSIEEVRKILNEKL